MLPLQSKHFHTVLSSEHYGNEQRASCALSNLYVSISAIARRKIPIFCVASASCESAKHSTSNLYQNTVLVSVYKKKIKNNPFKLVHVVAPQRGGYCGLCACAGKICLMPYGFFLKHGKASQGASVKDCMHLIGFILCVYIRPCTHQYSL